MDNHATAVELRAKGLTFEEIGQRLGMSRAGAFKAVQRALELVPMPGVNELRKLQDERLTILLAVAMEKAIFGSPDHINAAVRIEELRMKLWGTSARDQLEADAGRPSIPLELLRTMEAAALRAQAKLSEARLLPAPTDADSILDATYEEIDS